MSNPRSRSAYTKAAAQWLTQHPNQCHWCHTWTQTNLPVGHPHKATVDHLIEVHRAPQLLLNQQLWVVACWTCNSKRGRNYRTHKQHPTRNQSRNW